MRIASFFLLLSAGVTAAVCPLRAISAAPSPSGVPQGAILAFIPDPDSVDYKDLPSLRRWLHGQGWALCDGTEGTPDLHNRFLLGSESMEESGQQLGSRTHGHRVATESGPVRGRERRFNTGFAFRMPIPEDVHRHSIDTTSAPTEHLPLSTKVLYIIKIR